MATASLGRRSSGFRTFLELDNLLLWCPQERTKGWGVERIEATGFASASRLGGLLLDYLQHAPYRFWFFDPIHPESDQRDRVVETIELVGANAYRSSGIYREVIDPVGLAHTREIRALICDGRNLLGLDWLAAPHADSSRTARAPQCAPSRAASAPPCRPCPTLACAHECDHGSRTRPDSCTSVCRRRKRRGPRDKSQRARSARYRSCIVDAGARRHPPRPTRRVRGTHRIAWLRRTASPLDRHAGSFDRLHRAMRDACVAGMGTDDTPVRRAPPCRARSLDGCDR